VFLKISKKTITRFVIELFKRSVEKFKARKVGGGFSQEKGVNYEDTYT
jgi:hypothetical protein